MKIIIMITIKQEYTRRYIFSTGHKIDSNQRYIENTHKLFPNRIQNTHSESNNKTIIELEILQTKA